LKKISVTMIVIFVAFLALVSGGSLLMKDREFSPNENRYLAEPPRLTVDNILSGKFQDGLENYLRDQFSRWMDHGKNRNSESLQRHRYRRGLCGKRRL